ncbi:ribosome maturation protein [Xylariales sp. PMI_506]|nr:ribosome maturation protein [Xylariales sp. PMI_506]
MVKGEATQVKVHYKGQDEDFVVFVDDAQDFKKWLSDKSIPMSNFVSTFQVFITHKQGAQGQHDSASNATLENEFGTSNIDDAIKQILEKGNLQESEFPERHGPGKSGPKLGAIVNGQTTR